MSNNIAKRRIFQDEKYHKTRFCIIIIFMCFTFGAFAESGIITTSGGPVNVRKEPKDRARIEMTIKNRKIVEVLDHSDGWYHIIYNEKEGYVKEYAKALQDRLKVKKNLMQIVQNCIDDQEMMSLMDQYDRNNGGFILSYKISKKILLMDDNKVE